MDQIQRLTDPFGKQCRYVEICNAAHSDSFTLFESSEVRAQLNNNLGGREIAMSRVQDWLVEALDAENLTIPAAVKHPGFSLLDRQRPQTWQRKLYAEIESVANPTALLTAAPTRTELGSVVLADHRQPEALLRPE